ncbi:hypothetical protein FOL47_007228 [Perkinsus chesapeaki]|uniref:RING-type E3 ubiquitin transferase n=1 Tax=Perkinsus chesapeaki TaxID=330153 RepID=A0A7J6MW01_PERCH|nr:hypothetical protein FOL47_007228 [Perkinsus chesapeaki]
MPLVVLGSPGILNRPAHHWRWSNVFLGFILMLGFWLMIDSEASGSNSADYTAALDSSNVGKPSSIYRGVYTMTPLENSPAAEGVPTIEGEVKLHMISKGAGMKMMSLSEILLRFEHDNEWHELQLSPAIGLQNNMFAMGIPGAGPQEELIFSGRSDLSRFRLAGVNKPVCDIGPARITIRTPAKDDMSAGEVMVLDGKKVATGTVVSDNCGFKISMNLREIDVKKLGRKVINYSILNNIITILQIRFFLLQMQHGESNNGHAKVSLLCIGIQALMDAYDSLIHLFLGLSAQFMFNTFSVVALFKFILFSMLEVRYLLLVWRSRRQNQFNDGGMDSIRRELSWLYSRFYGSADRVYPALPTAPNSAEATLIVCLQVAQVAIMWAQAKFGPRSFVPWICLPHVYNYYRAIPPVQDEELGAPECVICMNDIDLSETQDPELRPVITPCDHIFHAGCLEQWMDVKMECPTCRGELPAMT